MDIERDFSGLKLIHHNLPGKAVAPHAHPEHLLFLPLQGEIWVRLRDREMKAGKGSMIYLPPETKHSFRSSDQQGERLIAMISPTLWKKLKGESVRPSHLAGNQLAKELLFYLLLHPETPHHRSLIATLIGTLNESLLASCHLLEVNHLETKVNDPRLQKVLHLFSTRIESPPSMTESAKTCGLSVRSMNRLFHDELSLTPKQVLTQYRINRAKDLISSGSSVTEAAFSVGYQSLTQFIASFRQLTGRLPSDYSL